MTMAHIIRRFTQLAVLNRKHKTRAATAVEMALIAPVFFLFLIGTVEMGLMFTAQQLMENAAFNTSRLAKTGFVATGKTQLETINEIMVRELSSYGSMFDSTKITLSSVSYDTFSSAATGTGGTAGLGTAEQVVVYTMTYPWKLFTPMLNDIIGTGGYRTLTTSIVVRNEPGA